MGSSRCGKRPAATNRRTKSLNWLPGAAEDRLAAMITRFSSRTDPFLLVLVVKEGPVGRL